ncbi:hypothetical protein RRG08_055601 [Elysia crispata]|uniref:DNA excision repair protein ERCC-8 n=1 Tax=Elysia crispata TaxID=231223 RepID=A0AAE1B144_9GAST|nr:hypothetical protein RRG08_055601 [Elysia crispata]
MKSLSFGSHWPCSSVIHGLEGQRSGLVRPLQFQRSFSTYFTEQLELSRHKEVQSTYYGAVNDLDVDITERRYLLSGYSDGSIALHDLQNLLESPDSSNFIDSLTYKLVGTVSAGNRNAHKRSIETVQWYPLDTGIFTSSGTDRILKIWDANRLQTAEEYSFSGIVHCHHMSPVATKHTLVAVGTDSSVVKLVDPRAGSATHCLRGHREGAVRAVRWSNTDEFILATGGIDNFAMLWDVRTAKGCLMKMQDKGCKKKSGYQRDTTHDGSVNGVEFTPSGHHLLTIGTDQKMYAWDTLTGKKQKTRFPTLSHIKRRSVKFCLTNEGSENFLFIPTGSSVTSFGLSCPGKVRRLYGHYNSVNCTAYHAPGQQMLSGGNDHKILVWSVRGDLDYGAFRYEQREVIRQRTLKEEVAPRDDGTTVVEDGQAVAQLQDTWSDDEEDADGDKKDADR